MKKLIFILFLLPLFSLAQTSQKILSSKSLLLPSIRDTAFGSIVQPTDNTQAAISKLQAQLNSLKGALINTTGNNATAVTWTNDKTSWVGWYLSRWINNTGSTEGYIGYGSGNSRLYISSANNPINFSAPLHYFSGTILPQAGTATVAPLQLTSGVNITTPISGSIEYDGINLYYTDNIPTRRTLLTTNALSATSPIFYNSGTGVISSQAASGSQNGYLASIDWNTFNNKQPAISGTGFVKASGSVISFDNSSYVPTSTTVAGFPLSGNVTLASLTNGYGISSLNYTGASTVSVNADSTSATGIVSKTRLNAALALYLRSNSFANPTGTIGLTAINGSATTPMRSDAAPALSQAITPTWTNLHTFNAGLQATNIGIGAAPVSTQLLNLGGTVSGAATIYGINNSPTIGSAVTSSAYLYRTTPSTAAASFTLGSLYNFIADGVSLGSGSAVTTQFGFIAGAGMTAATNNFGFYGNIASGTGRWNFYAAGTALNYFNGRTLFGTTTDDGSSQIQVNGSASVRHLIGNSSAPTIAAGPGAGTGAAVNLQVGATDLSGVITVSTGTSPTGSNAVIATVTFNTAYGTVPKVILTPSDPNAAALTGATAAFVPCIAQTNGVTTTTFKLVSGTTALPGNVYFWTYQVTQ